MWRKICAALGAFVVMFWNVENLFDPFDDPLKNDDEFTARGERHWTWQRFESKCDGIAQTIVAVADQTGELPALVGLAEVENRFVVSHLARKTLLSELGYGFVHRESPDERGIDVALLYRKDRFRVLAVDSLRIPGFATRDILHVTGTVIPDNVIPGLTRDLTRDPLHIFVVHLPSKRGGTKATESRRDAALSTLSSALDSLLSDNPESRIIVMGDFNDTAPVVPGNVIPGLTRDLGTLKYHGRWEQIDHFFLSPAEARPSDTTTSIPEMQVFAPEFLLEPDKSYLGKEPRRTYVGPRYNGGLSDHLPIILKLCH